MKTIDVRLTFARDSDARYVAYRLFMAAAMGSMSAQLLRDTANAIVTCIEQQTRVRESYEQGRPFTPLPELKSFPELRRKS